MRELSHGNLRSVLDTILYVQNNAPVYGYKRLQTNVFLVSKDVYYQLDFQQTEATACRSALLNGYCDTVRFQCDIKLEPMTCMRDHVGRNISAKRTEKNEQLSS